jgi:hypothetical protein
MPIFRRKNCIHTASGIVALCKRMHSTPVDSRLCRVCSISNLVRRLEDNVVCWIFKIIFQYTLLFLGSDNDCLATVPCYTDSTGLMSLRKYIFVSNFEVHPKEISWEIQDYKLRPSAPSTEWKRHIKHWPLSLEWYFWSIIMIDITVILWLTILDSGAYTKLDIIS